MEVKPDTGKDEYNPYPAICITVVVTSIFWWVIFDFFLTTNTQIIQRSAIKAGVGEYYIDEKYNKAFRFVNPTPKSVPTFKELENKTF